MPNYSKVTPEMAERIVMYRDKEGFSWHLIAKLENITRTGAQYVYNKHLNTELYQNKLRYSSKQQKRLREGKKVAPPFESQEMSRLYAKDFEGAADYRKAFSLVFGTSKLEEYA